MKQYTMLLLSIFYTLASTASLAEPTTGRLKIITVRPYHQASAEVPADVYITVDQQSLCGTSVYRIPLGWNGAKESVAVAIAALTSGRDIQIEIDNAGCATPAWTTRIQSIYLW